MNSIEASKPEKDKLRRWAKSLGEQRAIFYPVADRANAGSCFTRVNAKETGVRPYDFHNIAEVRAKLDELWQGEQIMSPVILPCAVATFKNKPKNTEVAADQGTSKTEADTVTIPDYIYVF